MGFTFHLQQSDILYYIAMVLKFTSHAFMVWNSRLFQPIPDYTSKLLNFQAVAF
jgi:hypothetical protein